MAAGFYLFFIIALCLFITHVYPSIIADDRFSPINDLNIYDAQKHELDDGQVFVSQRAADSGLPPLTNFLFPSSPSNEYLKFVPKKRHSFGRKHHWDTFFGRRR